MIGNVSIKPFLFFIERLKKVAELRAELRALVFLVVVSRFEFFVSLERLRLAVRHFDSAWLSFVRFEVALLALPARGSRRGLDVVGDGGYIRAPIGKVIGTILDGQDFCSHFP